MIERNNEDWYKDVLHPEIVTANTSLMKDCCLLVKGKSHGALVASIFYILPIQMKSCKPENCAKFWLSQSKSLSRIFVAKQLKNLHLLVNCKKKLHGAHRVIKFYAGWISNMVHFWDSIKSNKFCG